MRYPKFYILLMAATFILSCKNDPLKVNLSKIKSEVKITRYEDELFSLGNNLEYSDLQKFRQKYPDFTDIFTYQVIQIGGLTDTVTTPLINHFLTDSTILSARKMAAEQFSKNTKWKKNLVKAFKRYQYYYPGKPIPEIYTCISGFNESVFTSGNIIGISLDKYLGAQCKFYSLLGLPLYKQRKMIPEMIPSDVLTAWAHSLYELNPSATTLLDRMVHEGKLMYFNEAMNTELPDSLIAGFSAKQLKWCKKNESQMWTFLIENKMLYSNQQMDIVRYINDGPFTNSFPNESPGRTGVWIGWQIIRKYMKMNPVVTLPELMSNQNYQQILNSSAYAPN